MTIADVLAGAAGCALLFVLFTLIRPVKECSGDCGSCTGACPADRPTEGGNR